MIPRAIPPFVRKLAGFYPVVTILGPRQSGKTTLAKALFPAHEYRSLEAEDIRLAARDDPRGFLANGTKPMVIDEVQRFPSLLTYIQEMADARGEKGQYILTGSQQPDLAAAIGESLAGRTGICELLPLSLGELDAAGLAADTARDALLWRGFMPRLWADDAPIDPATYYRDYFQTYVQRDVRRLVNIQDLDTFSVFVRLLAGRAGQLLNRDSLARDAGISVPTAVKWLNALEASFLVFRLRPWHGNLGSRQIKSPKIYFTDVGLAAYLLGIETSGQMIRDPLRGNTQLNWDYRDFKNLGPKPSAADMLVTLTMPEKEIKLGVKLNYLTNDSDWEERTRVSDKYREVNFDEILKRFMAL